MTVFPDTQAVTLEEAPRRRAVRDSFLSQTPLALMAIAAIVAIVAVNTSDAPETAAPSRTTESRPAAAPAPCPSCGQVVSIKPLSEAAGIARGYALEVRMSDGSLRVVEQPAREFSVGDRVRVDGNTLAKGG